METDGKQCTRKRGCCPNGEALECLEVRNEGKDILIRNVDWYSKTMSTGYLGYYGGCVDSGSTTTPAIYHEMDVRHGYRKPFVLHRVEEISIVGAGRQRKTYTKEQLGVASFWVMTRDTDSHNVGLVCPSVGLNPSILPDNCDWKYLPDDLSAPQRSTLDMELYPVPNLSVKKVSESLCTTPFDPTACDECVDRSQIPEVIAIAGASERRKDAGCVKDDAGRCGPLYDDQGNIISENIRWFTIDLNGQYSRNGKTDCYRGLPYWIKGMFEIAYDHYQDQWVLSYHGVGAEHLRFAECKTPKKVRGYQDLSACTVGEWTHIHEEQDWYEFVPDETMTILPQWFVCSDLPSAWTPDTIFIEGAPPKAGNLNGDYSRSSENEQCGDPMPSFTKGSGAQSVEIRYDSGKGQWKILSGGTEYAKCTTDHVIGTTVYQDLSRCTEGMWKIHKDYDSESFNDGRSFHEEPEMTIHPKSWNFNSESMCMGYWFECETPSTCPSPPDEPEWEVSLPDDSESKPSEKGWLADNWWVLLVSGLGLIILIVLAYVFYWRRNKAAASASEGNVRVWVGKTDKKGTAEGKKENEGLMGDEKNRKKRKKEKAKAQKEKEKKEAKKASEKTVKANANEGTKKKEKAKGGKKSKGKKGAKK